ncbi:hypothetical protein [Seonamhaeicola marinus]|uniref:Uncharacterized protein n=1 Tax=Seonamhaeicola marinus TaxID=1912246 RepID=A0A5D0IZ81_9FLAO|nr:hypothetical protein [Seonamhaeicola marinus]TYA89203.1 hypothetical protein FUA24_03445 [Seonamhaeicola marinus]
MNYKEIISAVNKRYILLKKENKKYEIYDKLQGAFLYINDPIINYDELIKELKRRSSKIYKSIEELPEPVQKPIDWRTSSEEINKQNNILIKRMYDNNQQLTGVVVTYFSQKIIKNLKEKEIIENRLIDFIHDNIFRNEGISTFKNSYRDTASVIAINNINELPEDWEFLNM